MKHFLTPLLTLLVFIVGCGKRDEIVQSPQNAQQEAVTDSIEALKAKLIELSASGASGSAIEGIAESIEKNVSDTALKTALLKDAQLLNQTEDAARIRSISKKMAERL